MTTIPGPLLQPVPAIGRSKRLFPDQPIKNIFHILSPSFYHFRVKRQVGIVFYAKQALLRVLVTSIN